MSVATQSEAVRGSPSTKTARNATNRTLAPSTGVATETSPRLSARKVKYWPAKKTAPTIKACNTAITVNGPPCPSSNNQNSWKSAPMVIFTTKPIRHGPAPPSVERLRMMAATA